MQIPPNPSSTCISVNFIQTQVRWRSNFLRLVATAATTQTSPTHCPSIMTISASNQNHLEPIDSTTDPIFFHLITSNPNRNNRSLHSNNRTHFPQYLTQLLNLLRSSTILEFKANPSLNILINSKNIISSITNPEFPFSISSDSILRSPSHRRYLTATTPISFLNSSLGLKQHQNMK